MKSPETCSTEPQEQSIEGKLNLNDFRKVLQRERDNIVYWRGCQRFAYVLYNAIPALIRKYPHCWLVKSH